MRRLAFSMGVRISLDWDFENEGQSQTESNDWSGLVLMVVMMQNMSRRIIIFENHSQAAENFVHRLKF